MTNPPGPGSGEPPERGRPPRPAGPPNRGFPPRRRPPVPSESPTRHIPQPGRPPSTARDVPRPQQPGRPPGPPQLPPPPINRPPNPRAQPPGPPPLPHEELTTRISVPTTPPPATPADAPKLPQRAFFANRTSLLLILLIVALVALAVPIGAELYARHVASTKVANAVQCEVQDSASVSFSPIPPVLWQYLTKDYSDISVHTAGNQVRKAKGMKVSFDIHDVKLSSGNNSQGTIGSLNGTVTWSTDGIKQSIQDAVPTLGSFVTNGVTANASDGTIQLKGTVYSATLKPQIVNNGLSLQVVSVTTLGVAVPTAAAQKYMDGLMATATRNYPLGLHADSIKVTDSGVQAAFSTSNQTIPSGGSSDPCLAGLS